MPKVIILILLLAVIQYSLQASEEKEGKAGKGRENKLSKKCLKLVDEDTKKELEKGVCENDKTKKYLKCLYVSIFFMTCDGELNYEGVKNSLVRYLKSKEKGEAIAEKCMKSSDDPESTACKMYMCFKQSGLHSSKKKDDQQDASSSTA